MVFVALKEFHPEVEYKGLEDYLKKEDKEIEIYGILASQIDKNWNEKSNLNILA